MKIRARLSVALIVMLIVPSCAALNVNSLPVPDSSYTDGYDITFEFVSALNLPDRAKVMMDGTAVGVVTGIAAAKEHVEVTARIEHGIAIPSNIHAVLQQATVLGDIYLALERDSDSSMAGSSLSAGNIVPISQTTSPPQLEDTIANLANFVGSGSIQRAHTSIIGLNNITPAPEDVRKISSIVATDLADLSNNIDTVDQMLSGLSDVGIVLNNRKDSFQYWLSPEGLSAFHRSTGNARPMATLMPSLGTVYNGGYWLVPLIDSLGSAMGSVQSAKWSVEESLRSYQDFITTHFLPQDKYPAINITSIVGPDGRELSGNVEQVLRMLGAVP